MNGKDGGASARVLEQVTRAVVAFEPALDPSDIRDALASADVGSALTETAILIALCGPSVLTGSVFLPRGLAPALDALAVAGARVVVRPPRTAWECGFLEQRLTRALQCATRDMAAVVPRLQARLLRAAPRTLHDWFRRPSYPALLRLLEQGRLPTHAMLDEMWSAGPLRWREVEWIRDLFVDIDVLERRPARLTQFVHAAGLILRRFDNGVLRGMRDIAHRFSEDRERRLRDTLAVRPLSWSAVATEVATLRALLALAMDVQGDAATLQVWSPERFQEWCGARRWSSTAPARLAYWLFDHGYTATRLLAFDTRLAQWLRASMFADYEDALRQVRTDEAADPHDRIAALLLLRYGQRPGRILALTDAEVQTVGQGVRIRLGRCPVDAEPPLDRLLRQVVSMQAPGPLIPGGRPGEPLTEAGLHYRLLRFGIRPRDHQRVGVYRLVRNGLGVIDGEALLGYSMSSMARIIRACGEWHDAR